MGSGVKLVGGDNRDPSLDKRAGRPLGLVTSRQCTLCKALMIALRRSLLILLLVSATRPITCAKPYPDSDENCTARVDEYGM